MTAGVARVGQLSSRLECDRAVEPVSRTRRARFTTRRGTQAPAPARAAKIRGRAATGQRVDASSETVAEFVERWLKDWADHNVGNRTFTRYAQLLRNYLAARVGSAPIQKLGAHHLQGIYADMARAGLSARSRLHLHRVVSL